MALFDEAKADPDTPLQEINGFVEVDLALIIKAYEEAMLNSETEEGLIVSNYGEIEKNKGAMEMCDSIMGNFNKSGDSDKDTEPPDEIEVLALSIGDNPFGECFPCDGRITLGIDNLPHPAMFNIFGFLMDAIEAFIQQMKALLDPTNFYSDICLLLDALRIVCPADLLVLLALLRFLLSYYIMLSLQLNLDWVSILGLILMPILMLIHALLQMAINIGLGPLNCLIDLLVFASDLVVSVEATATQAADAAMTSVQSFKEAGRQVAGLVEDNDSDPPTQEEVALLSADPPDPSIPMPPDGGYRKYGEFVGKLNAFTSMLIAMSDIKFTLYELFSRFTNALEAIIRLLSAGLLLKMQLGAAIADILRLIGFLLALIKGLSNNSICDDPSVPLSSQDVQSLIQILNESAATAASSTEAGTTSSSDTTPLISSTIGLDFDTATGELVVTDKITDQSKRVPTCINALNTDDRDKISAWVEQLESSSV